MNSDHQIVSSQYPYNMANWCTEKARHILDGIVYFLEWTWDQQMPGDYKEIEGISLYSAIHDATKLLSFGCGATWSFEDPELIYRDGREGYNTVLSKYGLLKGQKIKGTQQQVRDFIERLEELLQGERVPNRTLIHELIQSSQLKRTHVDKIESLIENVTMDDLEWDDFVVLAKAELVQFKAELTQK
ncbi:MAG: hypothetical protein HC828_14395 [Blastochloris sp.]|nr:hypothetical protein [Blastochloris sp.]